MRQLHVFMVAKNPNDVYNEWLICHKKGLKGIVLKRQGTGRDVKAKKRQSASLLGSKGCQKVICSILKIL